MDTTKKLISVVIPCYNQGKYVNDAVESVLAQTYQNYEIVIVDDGSTDPDTVDLLKRYDKANCLIIHTENHGLPAARNTGIKATTGEYICCLDADDKYHPSYFEKAVGVLNEDKAMRYGAVPSWVQFFGESTILWKTIGHNTEGFHPFLQGLRNNIQSATMFRKQCWEKIGGYDETMTAGYEDWDFWIKMLDQGYEWFCIEEPLIYYRQKTQSMVTKADEIRPQILEVLIKKNQKFYSKHLLPMLLERDREVLVLQKENIKLINQLHEEHNDTGSSGEKSTHSNPFQSVIQALRRIFRYK